MASHALQTEAFQFISPNVAFGSETESHRFDATYIGDGGEFVVVAIENDVRIAFEEVENLGFRLQNAVAVNQILQVAVADIGHDHGVGAHDFRQSVHFAKVADTHLQHRHLVLVAKAENGEWHAQLIVEIALGFQHIVFLAKHAVSHLLGAGFAHAASDAYNGNVELLEIEFRNIFHCLQR